MNKLLLLLFFGLFLFSSCRKEEKIIKKENIVQYADPFIGTAGHGHTYPGATVPFGMLQVSPDNGTSGWDWCSGYHYSDSIMIGFSHLHLSGTGIGDLLDIRLMPINKKVDLSQKVKSRDDLPYRSSYDHKDEISKPGYYSVYLKDFDIKAELTSGKRTAYHRYTYKEGDQKSIVIDLGFSVNWDRVLESSVKIEDQFAVSGYRFSTGWAKNQKVFFAVRFSKPIEKAVMIKDDKYVGRTDLVKGVKTSVQLFFGQDNKNMLEAKVGLSSVSVENAKKNISDYNGNFNFDEVKEQAGKIWNYELSKIRVETPVDSLKTIFYTALYHAGIAPVTYSDANGEFRLENDSIVNASGFTAYSTLSLWDTFRAQQPLLTLINSKRVSDIINSMLVYYDERGTLPVWTLYANETNTMTGYHSIPVIAEAYLKGITGFDIEKAYKAMKVTLTGDARGLNLYKKYGYIPYDLLDESVTITLEYAYDDWCAAQIAKALGKEKDYRYFLNRSKAYRHLYDPKTGFMRGLSSDGKTWHEPFDPKFSAHRVHADYTEGNAWQHSWFVLQDTPDLIALHGGDKKFTDMLEQLFTESSEIKGDNVSPDISGLIGQYAHGNEPSHHIAYMFNFAGKPWRTQYWVRKILKTQYNTTTEGLSGNEDCGQMSAWYVFSAIGLYPYNPVSGVYQIGSPIFNKTTIKVSENKYFTIIAENASADNIYIQSATLNGKEFNRTSISHHEMMQGGTLHFIMGKTPNKNWGTTQK